MHRSRINRVKDGAGPGVKLVCQVQVGQASILRAIDLGMGELGIQEVRAGPRSTIWAGHTIVDHGDPAIPLSRGGRYDRAHEDPNSGRAQQNEDPEAPVPALVQPREVHNDCRVVNYCTPAYRSGWFGNFPPDAVIARGESNLRYPARLRGGSPTCG